MRRFKFFNANKKVFPYEMSGQIKWVPASFMTQETWTNTRSELIRKWISDVFFNDEIQDKVKYFPELDRTCEIVQAGLERHQNQPVFTTKVRLKRSEDCYMEIDLMYPII